MFTIHVGDCLDVLRAMPDESIHCCVTSPPYWGLRDYGTAEWKGGSEECDHKPKHRKSDGTEAKSSTLSGGKATIAAQEIGVSAYKDICGKCGAKRIDRQIGLEESPELFVAKMVEVFSEVRRVLRKDGTCWVNLGDSYNGSGPSGGPGKQYSNVGSQGTTAKNVSNLKPKDLCGIPWRVAFALQADGWWLRQDIIWHKSNPMPESVTDRCTKAHEYIFLLTKSAKYFYDAEAVKEEAESDHPAGNKSHKYADSLGIVPGGGSMGTAGGLIKLAGVEFVSRNKRSVWTVASHPFPEAHFATFPPKLIEPCILAGTSEEGCCPKCLAPWRRIVEKTKLTRERPNEYVKRTGEEGTGNSCANTVAGVDVSTVGWEPTCKCDAGQAIPCTVLDPFNGAGTTGLVSVQYGRNYIGIELNPEYAEMARRRIGKQADKQGLFQ